MRCEAIQAETMARPDAGRRQSDERKGKARVGKEESDPAAAAARASSEGLVGRRVSGERAPRVWNLGREKKLGDGSHSHGHGQPLFTRLARETRSRDPVHTGDHAYNACATL